MLRLGIGASVLLLVTASASGARTESNPLVGTWTRINSCPAFVKALDQAGLKAGLAKWLAGGGYFKTEAEVWLQHPCDGARNLRHSHFFTASGAFGSYDQRRNQVDDGDYQSIAPHTLAFPSHTREFGYRITVHYTISEGKLRFAVVVPKPCAGKCRNATAWAISAFYAGPPFTRSN